MIEKEKLYNFLYKMTLVIIIVIALILGGIRSDSATELFANSEKAKDVNVEYRTHIQSIGWQDYKSDGELAGTEGKSLRLEAINIKLNEDSNLDIEYQAHVQGIGWQDWKKNGETAGTEGEELRLEAIRIKLNEQDDYSVMYRVHVQNIGWQDWKLDGEVAGTEGQSLRIEAIEIKIIKKPVKHLLNIDTLLDNAEFNKDGIHIEGWKLAEEPNTKLEVYIDEKGIEEKYIKYSYKYDLISIASGYGTREDNPTPNFNIDIPTDNIANGNHELKIRFVTAKGDILEEITKTIKVDKSTKSHLNIDTPLENQTFYKSGIHIEGWKLATEPNTRLDIYINNEIVDEEYIKYSYKYDLVSIVPGYGTREDNPTPNFDINIPTDNMDNGKYTLKIEFRTSGGELLEQVVNNIIIDKRTKSHLNIDTNITNNSFDYNGIHIEGWKLATEPNTNIKVYIDEKEIDEKYIKYSYKYDLISIVPGYGTREDNPTPNFDVNIPLEEIENGKHRIKIELVASDGTVLQKKEGDIVTDNNFFQMHIETIYDRNSITNEPHTLSGWLMTNKKNTTIKLMIDGEYQKNVFTRTERPDVNTYFNNIYSDENPTPGFSTDIDFSKLTLGLHQIALRVFDENENKIGEQVLYVFVQRKITVEEGTYGKSAYAQIGDPRGTDLKYYRYGDGPNVLFATFSIHGFEDNWDHDGKELTFIANEFYKTLKNNHSQDYALADTWTIYILPTVNPDGQTYGYTENGPGRTTMYSIAPNNKGIDLNRCWKYSGFNANASSRNYAGTAPFQSYEAQYLRDFLQSHKSINGQTILVDLHGWLQQLIGDREIGMYYAVQFQENNGYSLDKYGDGYLINWARTALASNGKPARTSLIELPEGAYSHEDVVNRRFAERYINATLSMLNGIL